MTEGAYKPNIYPIMFWGLTYGVTAAVVLFIIFLLARFITIVWFPVFLAGVIWGCYRNYKKQKQEWQQRSGAAPASQSFVTEFREAAEDIVTASREVLTQEDIKQPDNTSSPDTTPEAPLVPAEDPSATPTTSPPSSPSSPSSGPTSPPRSTPR